MEETAMTDASQSFLREAIRLARANSMQGGRPFGAVVVKDGRIVATGVNEILATGDPTAHAELNALRATARALGSPNLRGCVVFASGHPCPMCLAAMRLAGITEVAYAYTNEDGAPYGLSTAALYADLAKPFAEQAMTIRHDAAAAQADPGLYADWQREQRIGKGA
ncbi:nucleoside deaminase [Lysobacter sp. KIS68-7]|uniref:nucleoside deaminase n=1 Tax=Lysobacter sp. KIS68-7 TaxID=2904252 RepID=UPI001E59E7EA|nr:nucleoside deaminase [Lysobacter sp. KIS68-7]UHQ19732.1 nucleoside deaminase [Lysobacter sp. KIS68-7]